MSYPGIIDQYIRDELLNIKLHKERGTAILVEDRGSKFYPCEPRHLTCRVEHALVSSRKRVNLEWVARELAWFMAGKLIRSGDDALDVNNLGPAKPMWEPWADQDGGVHVPYAELFSRDFAVAPALRELRSNPWSRRAFASVGPDRTWALQPCHHTWQLVRNAKDELNVIFHMRSTDLGLGLPFNMASYAMFAMSMAKSLGLKPGWIDAFLAYPHIYEEHFGPMLDRWSTPRPDPAPSIDFDGLWADFPDSSDLEWYGFTPPCSESVGFFQSLNGYVKNPAPYLKLPLHYRPK